MIKCREQQINSNNQAAMLASSSSAIKTSRQQRRKKSDDDSHHEEEKQQRCQNQEILKKLETCNQVNCSYRRCTQQLEDFCSCCCQQEQRTSYLSKSAVDTNELSVCRKEQLEAGRNCDQQVAPSSECVKCQLIVKWTKAQAEIARKARSSRKERSVVCPAIIGPNACHESTEKANRSKIKTDRFALNCSENEEENEEGDVDKWSSWSEDNNNNNNELVEQQVVAQEKLSRSSLAMNDNLALKKIQHGVSPSPPQHQQNYSRILSFRRRRLALRLAPLGLRKRRPAPMPPAGASRWSSRKAVDCGASSDSGHTSGPEVSSSQGDADSTEESARQLVKSQLDRSGFPVARSAPELVVCGPARKDAARKEKLEKQRKEQQCKPSLLSESELFSMEHFLRSHKSAVYVCGCMANLYLTNTKLVDNGRYSRPTADNWQLTKTGVPVLTFDSGLTKNRQQRRLTINLAERGSGFVLWSDIIDHLSNYRAYSAELHGHFQAACRSSSSSSSNSSSSDRGSHFSDLEEESCSPSSSRQVSYDTFHVMYLSSNHRLMVGLSFDDATCARLFLRQIELITSDPANISLTGPKLVAGKHSKHPKALKLNQRLKSTTSRLLLFPCAPSPCPPKSHAHSFSSAPTSSKGPAPARRSAQIYAPPTVTRETSQTTVLAHQSRPTNNTQPQTSSSDHYTWSTLKRAIRLRRFRMTRGSNNEKHHEAESGERKSRIGRGKRAGILDRSEKQVAAPSISLEEQLIVAACQPRPLAALAASGREYRAGRKLPSKCDISAPCLFQHVARVDLSALERLYSGSLIGCASKSERLEENEQQQASSPHGQPRAGQNTPTGSSLPESDRLAELGQSKPPSSHHSSSSCYSSAGSSISPANSDCGRSRQPRPLPPARSLEPENSGQPDSNGPKIQAVIRELQAQTSSELVNAKRRLMADIANQARTISTSHL